MRLLDTCCCGGAASHGYSRAGFEVEGVDTDATALAHYPYRSHRYDVLDVLNGLTPVDVGSFDVVASSPPCQRYSSRTPEWARDNHPDLVPVVRGLLREHVAAGRISAYVIENVVGAPLLAPVRLCGSAFGLGVWRHRLFESNLALAGTGCAHEVCPDPVDVTGSSPAEGVQAARAAMGGCEWLPWEQLREAVPPAFTEFLGRQVIASLSRRRVASPGDVGLASPAVDRDASSSSRSVPSRRCRCGEPLVRPATGRWPLYCGQRCRQAAFRAARAGAAR